MKFYYHFLESIRLLDGRFDLISFHEARMIHSLTSFGIPFANDFRLETYLNQFPVPEKGLFKCRLLYGLRFAQPDFVPYRKRSIKSLQLVEDKGIDYDFKYANRNELDFVFHQRSGCDEVLLVRDGFITDTTFTNIAFRKGETWFTPKKPLLNGVRRKSLLQSGILQENDIKPVQLSDFETFKLFNAMIPWDEAIELPVQRIHFGQKSE